MTRDVIKFCPGARYSGRLNCWLPVVRIFRNNKPAGSKTGNRPMSTPMIAEAHALRAAREVARSAAIAGRNVIVALPKGRALPSERLAGAVYGTRLLQVQV